jgi:deoxyribonuclease V
LYISHLHPWNLDFTSARQLQIELRSQLDLSPQKLSIKTIAGCDVSGEKWGKKSYSAVVVMSFPEFQILEQTVMETEINFPYIPGLLSFREMPGLLNAWKKIQNVPDLVLCDGCGTIHPRKFGLACHLGLWLGIPTIGCAKNLLCGEHKEIGQKRGDWEKVIYNGETVGTVVRTRDSIKPLYISPGNLISWEQAMEFILATTIKYRLPEPIRTAHMLANKARKFGN